MAYIIGSGLTAMAAAVALVQQGCRPTVLDVGLTPDSETELVKDRLSATEPESWRTEDLKAISRIGPSAANGIPRKLHFGSDFTFRQTELALPMEISGASIYRSFAMGGFSNVWGTVINPFSAKELENWPITQSELDPHYAAVRALLFDGNQGVGHASTPTLQPSSQAYALYSDLNTNRRALEAEGICFGYASLGVRQSDSNSRPVCRYCGLCLYGCPYGCIYTASSTLYRLVQQRMIHYVCGMYVDKLTASGGRVRIEARSLKTGGLQSFYARRVFLATGVLETARIVLVSVGIYERPVLIRQSDIFTMPLLRYNSSGDVFSEKLHTLCQLAAEIKDNNICDLPVHLQIYGYNDLYLRLLQARFRVSFATAIMRTIITRFFVIFGYLHSCVSSTVQLRLSNNGDKLLLKGLRSPLANQIMHKVGLKLFHNRRLFHGIPLFLLARLDLPGGSYHSGCTFPMRRTPGLLETDRLGRLSSLPGVHIVDASILPSIPASPIAFTVMANAHRIASECQKSDEQ